MNVDSLNGGFVQDWYITNKYKDLKQEMLQNKICKISAQTFEYYGERKKYYDL